jgi:hypothetical protein
MKMRLLLLVVLLVFPAVERSIPPRAALVGGMLVLTIPHVHGDPSVRRYRRVL